MFDLLEMLERCQRANDSVFVESESPVGAAEICPVRPVDLGVPRLRRHGLGVNTGCS